MLAFISYSFLITWLFSAPRLTPNMASCWDVINTEWDTDQETVNFGTRQCVVIDSALFDVVTLATVECSNPVMQNLHTSLSCLLISSYCSRAQNQNQK